MFVPCDENGNVLEEPDYNEHKNTHQTASFLYNWKQKYSSHLTQYQQAKERCLFEGFEYDKKMEYWHNKCISFDEEYFENKTIEDIVKYDLELTQTAQKQIGL